MPFVKLFHFMRFIGKFVLLFDGIIGILTLGFYNPNLYLKWCVYSTRVLINSRTKPKKEAPCLFQRM